MVTFVPRTAGQLAIAVTALVLSLFFFNATTSAAPRGVQGGTLDWGVKASFRNYITGPIAHGAITTTGGASRNADGTFRFPVQPGGSFDSATGALTVMIAGGVHFTGHDGQLDMTLTNLRIQMNGASGSLMADLVSKSMTGTSPSNYPGVNLLTLSGPPAVPNATGLSLTGVNTSLSAAGAPAFAGFYTAGTAFDPLSLSALLAPEQTTTTSQVSPSPIPSLPQPIPYIPPIPQPAPFVPQPIPFQPQVPPVPQALIPQVPPTPVTLAPPPAARPNVPPAAPPPVTQPINAAPTSSVRPPATGDAGLVAITLFD